MAWIQVVWHVMLCPWVTASQHFGGTTFLHIVGKQKPSDTASHPTRQESLTNLSLKSHMLHAVSTPNIFSVLLTLQACLIL